MSDSYQDINFTVEEIKKAFWETFHEHGEFFFPYKELDLSAEVCTNETNIVWIDFLNILLAMRKLPPIVFENEHEVDWQED